MTIQQLFDEYVSVSKDYQVSGVRQQQIIQEVEALVRKETIEEIIKMIPEHQKPITSKKYTEIKKDNPHVPNIQFFLGENIGRNGFRQSMYIVLRKYAQSKGIIL